MITFLWGSQGCTKTKIFANDKIYLVYFNKPIKLHFVLWFLDNIRNSDSGKWDSGIGIVYFEILGFGKVASGNSTFGMTRKIFTIQYDRHTTLSYSSAV